MSGGEMSRGRNVRWGEMSRGRNVRVGKCPGGEMSGHRTIQWEWGPAILVLSIIMGARQHMLHPLVFSQAEHVLSIIGARPYEDMLHPLKLVPRCTCLILYY